MPLIPDVGIEGKTFGYRGCLWLVVTFAFDGNCHVVVTWCVAEDMFGKLSNVTQEDIRNYRTT